MRNWIIAAAAMASLLACQKEEARKPVVESLPPAASATTKSIDVKISGDTFSPASVTIPQGQPVRINFTRDEKPTCGESVVIAALNVKKEIPVNQTVSIDIPPQQAGELKFTCGMDMMKGTIVVQ